MQHKRNLNIVVVGKSGAGKSSLLNYLADNDIFDTGVGIPVTQSYFNLHTYTNPVNNITYNLYDTKGIEPGITDEFLSVVNGEIDKFKESDDFFEHIHTLYYCIDASSKRIEPFEENFIKKISKELDVVIVLTKVDLVTERELQDFYSILKKDFNASEKDIDADIRLANVCSVAKRTRKGTSEKHGREDVLKHSFVGLWNTFSKTISNKIYYIIYLSGNEKLDFYDYEQRHIYSKINLHSLRLFKTTWKNYFKDVQGDEPQISLFNILRFPELEKICLDQLDIEEKALLSLNLNSCKCFLENFYTCKNLLKEFQEDITKQAQRLINFYSQITGRKCTKSIALRKSFNKLNDLENFILQDLKDYLLKEINDFISTISFEPLKDGWFSNAATDDKERLLHNPLCILNNTDF